MTSTSSRGPGDAPVILFLDVDGTLIPYGGAHPGLWEPGDALARLNPDHGQRLAALSCELVWATAWTFEANEEIVGRIGLPELPVVEWPDEDDEDLIAGVHWKTPTLVEWAAGRSFVWVDDEITERDREWVRAHHSGQALLHRVEGRRGLTDEDFAAIARWLAGQRRS